MLTRVLATVCFVAWIMFASDHVTITGTITDDSGKRLEGSTVFIYRAGVKKGYSTYCPTCYTDCGKHAVTDSSGSFSIEKVSGDLWFDLVAIREGYAPAFIRKFDPAGGRAETKLQRRDAVTDPSCLVRGRVVDSRGRPMARAVVEPLGFSGVREGKPFSMYGMIEGLDPVAVTNARGEFELAHRAPATGMLLRVQARGMAPRLVAVSTGADRKDIVVSGGAAIEGRLLDKEGKPVSNAEIGLIGRPRGGYGSDLKIVGNPHNEFRIGTQPDGSFAITNVPAPGDWYIYAKMESIAARGAMAPVACSTVRDGEVVNIGDLWIGTGLRLRGRVVLSDGSAIPEGMRVILGADRAWDSQTAILGRDGRFEFSGLYAGEYTISPAVRGYTRKESGKVTVDRDLDGIKLVMEPNPGK